MKRFIVATLLLSLPLFANAFEEPLIEANALSAPNGRYVFGQVSPGSVNQFMLDTQTGRLWRMDMRTRTLVDVLYTRNLSNDVAYSFFPLEAPKEPILEKDVNSSGKGE